jgi:predicted Zn-dependent peptidase
MDKILNKVAQYKQNGLDAKLFEAVRRDLYGRSVLRFDAAENVCSMLTDATVLGYSLFEYFDALSKITPEDAAERLSVFSSEKAVLSVVNPTMGKEA